MISYEECKKKVAEKNGWKKLVTGHRMTYFDEAAELYLKLRLEEIEKEKETNEKIQPIRTV